MDRKEELKLQIEEHRNALDKQVTEIKSKGKQIGVSALVVGGAFLLTYTIVRGIAAGRSSARDKYTVLEEDSGAPVVRQARVKPKKSGMIRKLTGLVMTEIAVILAGVAKTQIKNFISNMRDKDENDEEFTE